MRTLIIISLLFFFGCRPTKVETIHQEQNDSIVYVTKLQKDTVRILEVKTVTDSVDNYIEIDCDSTAFQQAFNNGKTKLNIAKENGKVTIRYLQNPMVDYYKLKYEKQVAINDSIMDLKSNAIAINTIIKYKIPVWFWWLLLGSNLLWIFFRNTIFKLIKII